MTIEDLILQAIGVIEADADFYKKLETKPKGADRDYDVWALIHPQIAEVSKKRISDGYYADADTRHRARPNRRGTPMVQD